MRLLIIEDEEDLVDALAKGLRREGYAADVALNGEEGLALAEINAYDFRWLPQLTLRARLVLYTAALSLALNLILVLLINALAGAFFPQSTVTFTTPETSLPSGNPAALAVVPQALLGQLQTISAFGLAVITVLTAAGAYWLAGRTLLPLRIVSSTALQISANTLNRRLALQGPADEVKELSDAFDVMLDRLQRAFSRQGQFAADAAHELRTPPATLRTNLDVVQADPDATLSDYREMAVVLERALTRLDQLDAGLLILATDEHALVPEPVSLQDLLLDVLHSLEALAAQRQVTLALEPDPDPAVYGDAALLARAFSNLLENGIRYNRPGGLVTVAIREQDAWAVVTVSDTGIGIPAEEQAHVFDRFYRVDRSRARHQAGLGLAIVAHIIEQHKGTIQVASAPDNGTTLAVRLPRQGC